MSMSASTNPTRPFWAEIEVIFDPELPVEDPRLFAERDPAYNPLATLERMLQRQTPTHRKVLVAGTIGNGKTSELHHFATRLSGDRMFVLVDLWRHFQGTVGDAAALKHVETWELLGLLGLAIHRAGEELFGHRWKDEPKLLQKALEELRKADQGDKGPAIDVAKLAKGMVVVASLGAAALTGPFGVAAATGLAITTTVTDAASWQWKIGFSGRERREDQEIHKVLGAVNAMIMALQSAYNRRLLLLVDGLDRAGEDRMTALFVESGLLGELTCDAVWIAEDSVRRLDSRVRGFAVHELCNVPVLDRADPTQPGRGLGFFRSLVARRVAVVVEKLGKGPSAAFPDELVDRLAYYSGGVTRDFIKMIRMIAGEAWDGEAEAITLEMVDYTLRESRRAKERAMHAGEIELLEQLMIDRERKLPDGELAGKLVADQRMLAYPNETIWYYPHPLLTLALLKPKRGSAG